MPSNRLQAIPLGTFNSANLTANYQALYPGGLPHAVALLRIINTSNVAIYVSYDGVTNNDIILSGDELNLWAQMNAQPRNQVMYIPAGTLVSIKQVTVPGAGSIFISGYYTE